MGHAIAAVRALKSSLWATAGGEGGGPPRELRLPPREHDAFSQATGTKIAPGAPFDFPRLETDPRTAPWASPLPTHGRTATRTRAHAHAQGGTRPQRRGAAEHDAAAPA